MRASSRVVVNTAAQLIKSIVSVIVVLWTSRVVLQNLGVQDYGIYSLVGGVISILGFLRISLASTTQRYLSYYQNEDIDKLKCIFNNSIISHFFIGLCVCVTLAALTVPIFSNFLNIPQDRTGSAFIVYFFVIGCLFISLISIPYVAALISKENIVYTSAVLIVEAILKIPIALSLLWVHYDKLEWYACLIFFLNMFSFGSYFVYCLLNYEECRIFRLTGFKSDLFKEMFFFSGWDMYGNGCHYIRKQGVAVLLNNFFSVSINAAYGIGYQVASQIEFTSASLMTATRPQIIKAESEHNRYKVFRAAEITSKFSFLFLSMIVVPLGLNIDFILKIWLGNVPQYAGMFCVSFFCITLANVLTNSFNIVNQAIGHVKSYNLIVNTIRLVILPVVYIALIIGAKPYVVMCLYFTSEFCCSISRIVFVHYDMDYPIKQYIYNVFFPCLIPFISNFLLCLFVKYGNIPYELFISASISMFATLIITYMYGITNEEKDIIKAIMARINKLGIK